MAFVFTRVFFFFFSKCWIFFFFDESFPGQSCSFLRFRPADGKKKPAA